LKKNKPLQEESNMKKIPIILGMLFILGASILSESTLAATYVNQSVTAYVADQGSLTYHGTVPVMYSTAAVRPKVCGNALSGTKFPAGTIITTQAGLPFPDARLRSTFQVYDMGDVKCVKNVTPNWFDIFFGTSENYQHAINFGFNTASYNTSSTLSAEDLNSEDINNTEEFIKEEEKEATNN